MKMLKKTAIPSYEKELIIAHILKKSREYVLTHPEAKLTELQKKKYDNLIKRRQKNEPLAYILGYKEFYGLDFKITPATLIPRPETEILVEEVLKLEPKGKTIIDVGTGSGNIIISIAKNLKAKNNYFGIDISEKALRVAKQNAKKHKLNNPPAGGIKFIKSDLLKHFTNHHSLITGHCVIVANLPYLSKKIYSSAMPDVKNFEPKSALLSGTGGLHHYNKLFRQIKELKKKCYVLCVMCYVEFSPEQKKTIQKMIKSNFPGSKISFQKDLAGWWRIAQFSA